MSSKHVVKSVVNGLPFLSSLQKCAFLYDTHVSTGAGFSLVFLA